MIHACQLPNHANVVAWYNKAMKLLQVQKIRPTITTDLKLQPEAAISCDVTSSSSHVIRHERVTVKEKQRPDYIHETIIHVVFMISYVYLPSFHF